MTTSTPAQSIAALATGNVVRSDRARARRRVKAHATTTDAMAQLAAELEARPRWPRRLLVDEVLTWPIRSQCWHRARIARHAGTGPSTTVAGLTERQVGVLCHALRSPVVWRGR